VLLAVVCQITANNRRLQVALVVNLQSDAGHNALTWAVACNEPHAVEILLANGATANYSDEVLWQSARLIQQCWARYKWATGTERLKFKSIIERWLHDSIHHKELKRVVFDRRAVRRGSRVGVCEAVFNGFDEVRGGGVEGVDLVSSSTTSGLVPQPHDSTHHRFAVGSASRQLLPLLITKAAKGSLHQTTFVAPVGAIGFTLRRIKRNRRGSILNFESMNTGLNLLACAKLGEERLGCREVVSGRGWLKKIDSRHDRVLRWAEGKQSVRGGVAFGVCMCAAKPWVGL